METVRQQIAQARLATDESLDSERALTDTPNGRDPLDSRRILDDIIERDRISADRTLWKFRESADSLLARRRALSAARSISVTEELEAADRGTNVERADTYALLKHERERADLVVEKTRQEHDADHAEMEARRQDTNNQLLAERTRADLAVSALGESKVSLVGAQAQHGHDLDVLAMVTHDLRGPLSIISANAQHIIGRAQEQSMRETAEDITLAAARMERLLTDLVDVARIDAGALRIVRRPCDVGLLVADIHRSYGPLFAARQMTFAAERPAVGMLLQMDHDRVVQVISNLLANALKFTPPHGTVSLRVQRRADEVEFVIRDSGCGIEPSAIGHVFERFWKIDIDPRRGLGLGLHICKNIVEGHGGRIWVESTFEHGAAFHFTLPI